MIAALLFAFVVAPAPAEAGPAGGDLEGQVQVLFQDACSGCHDAEDDLNLDGPPPREMLSQVASTGAPMIRAGEPENSYLYKKLVGAPGIEGDPMPMGEDPLPAEQLGLVRDWIKSLASSTPAPVVAAGGTTTEADAKSTTAPVDQEAATASALPQVKPRPKKPFYGTHQINLQTTTSLGRNTLNFRIHHRFGRVGKPGDRTYLGLAGGVIMSLGVEYGIVDGLDVLARWTNSNLGWELGAKYVPVRQEEGLPLSFGVFTSFEALTVDPDAVANRFSGNFQGFVSRLWFERWSTQLLMNYSMFTNRDGSPTASIDGTEYLVKDRRGTLNLGFASTVWLGKKRKHGIDVEYQLPIPDGGDPNLFFYHGGDADPEGTKVGSWAVGWSASAGKHLFQVFVTNTRNIHTGLVAPGGDTHNPFNPWGDFFLGFNISRKWRLGK